MKDTYVTLFHECVLLYLKVSTTVSGFGGDMKNMTQSFLCLKWTIHSLLIG